MADDATPEPESDPAATPAQKHAPLGIEGEATEPDAAESEPSPSEAPADFPPVQASAAFASMAAVEASAAFAPTEAAEATADFAPTETAEATAEAATPPPPWADLPPPERRSGGSFVWGLSGVVIGAAVALGAAWYLDPRAEPLRDLTARQSALDAGAATQSAATKALDARIGALESAQAGFAKASALEALDKRLAKLEAASVTPEAVAAAQADAIAAREEAGKALAQAAAAGKGNEKPAPSAPAAGPDPRIAELAGDQIALGDRIDKLGAGLGDRIGKIEAALGGPKIETRVAPTEIAPKSDLAGQAVAALALEQRLRAGEPFAAEWAALSRLGADPAALATLKPYSETGAPTAAALAASFAKIAPGLVAAAQPDSGDGFVNRMLEHMRGLVRVRAVGEIAGEDPAALVSQIEAALAHGRVSAALEVYARLPEAARNAADDWAKTVEARAAADSAAGSLRESAIGRLAAAKN